MATMAGGEGSERALPRTILPEDDPILDGFKLTFPEDVRTIREFLESAARSPAAAPTPFKLHNVDCISGMPDEILQSIISLLTMREAAATSVLSSRWKNLWTTSLSCLNFDVPNMREYAYPRDIFANKSQDFITTKRLLFTEWVNHVSNQFFCHESLSLDALRVSFILNTDSTSDIDRWITSAVARGVTSIDLDFHYEQFYGKAHNPFKIYVFHAQQVASTIRYLHLKFCKLNLPPDFTGFTSLVSLSLFDVYVTQTLMEDIILSKCPLLEFLSVDDCLYPHDTSFEFTGASLRLKHLHIWPTYEVASIKVHNINLLSFELGNDVRKLSIRNTPHLARLVLLMEKSEPVEIMSDTPRLETLYLTQQYEKVCDVCRHPYALNNLKRLVLVASGARTNLLGVVHILEACHLLQKLELDMGITRKKERKRTRPGQIMKRLTASPGLPLNNLKEIEIYGFEEYREKVEFAKCLLKNAVVLQKMKIYTTSKVYRGNGRWEPFLEDNEKKATSLEEKATSLVKIQKELQDIASFSTMVELFSSLKL